MFVASIGGGRLSASTLVTKSHVKLSGVWVPPLRCVGDKCSVLERTTQEPIYLCGGKAWHVHEAGSVSRASQGAR